MADEGGMCVWHHWEKIEEPELTNPSVIVAVSTSDPRYVLLYSHAKELAKHLIEQLNFRQFAKLYSSAMPATIRVNSDGTAELYRSEAYYYRGKRDLVLYTSDTSPVSGAYEYSDLLLAHADKLGAKELFSIGTRFLESPSSPFETPEVLGFGTDAHSVQLLKEHGVKILANEPSYYFSSIIVGLAKEYGMRGYRISVNHGEPLPHPKSVLSMLSVMSKMLEFEIDLGKLKVSAQQLEEAMMKSQQSAESPRRNNADSPIYR